MVKSRGRLPSFFIAINRFLAYNLRSSGSKIKNTNYIRKNIFFDGFEDGDIRLEMAKNSHKNICVNLKKHIKSLSPSPPKQAAPRLD